MSLKKKNHPAIIGYKEQDPLKIKAIDKAVKACAGERHPNRSDFIRTAVYEKVDRINNRKSK